MEAARATPPPRQAAHGSPPLVTREAARETQLSSGGDRGWTRWWEGGGQEAKVEARTEEAKMEGARRLEEDPQPQETPASPGEAKHRPPPPQPPPPLLQHGEYLALPASR